MTEVKHNYVKKRQDGRVGFIACVKLVVSILAMTSLVLPRVATAQEPPLVCGFHGTVKLDGHPAPDGTVIKALIGGTEVASVAVPGVEGPSTYDLLITQPVGVSYSSSTEIRFKIDNYDAIETATWETNTYVALNLTAYTLATPTPTPSTTPLVTHAPSSSPTPNPNLTPTPAPATPTPEAASDTGRVIGVAVLAVVAVVLVGVLAYLLRRWFIR